MTKFNSREELQQAYGQLKHENNLNYGGVFNSDGTPYSSLDFEIEYAGKSIFYTHADHAKYKGIPETVTSFYINGFGYCEV